MTTGNLMYLVCVHHPDKADAFRLSQRERFGYGIAAGRELRPADRYVRSLEKFLDTHRHCGGGFDHFTIAFGQVKDYDLPKPEPLANGVHLALREAANSPRVEPTHPEDQAP